MAFLRGLGAYLPARIIGNQPLAEALGVTPEWIYEVSGIEERRYSGVGETVTSMGVAAAEDCLRRANAKPEEIGMVIVASGSSERRFPGPACRVAAELGIGGVPAIDLPMASAGSLFGLSLASSLVEKYGNILVTGSEKMSPIVQHEPLDRNVDILFGDGAGACLVSGDGGQAKLLDSLIQSDGAFAEDLKLEFGKPLEMNGRSVIMQASRKVPRVISQLLERNQIAPADVEVFLMHQANQNLIDRVAKGIGVLPTKFYSNIAHYGNTSSASLLIAASEWWSATGGPKPGVPVCFAAFGAGFHWGAALAVGT